MKSLKIGLVKREYGWERILEQEKVTWEIVNFNKDISIYSLLILNSNKISEVEINNIKSYLSKGGALLTDTLSFNLLDKTRKISKIYIRNIVGKGDLFRNIDKINIESWGWKLKNSNYGLINEKFSAIYTSRFGKGFVIVLPFSLGLLMSDERSKKIYFSSPYTLLEENASLVSKGDLRRLIVNCFHYLCFMRNIPYIHIWYYPKEYKSVFCYRIDLDIFNKKEINNIVKIIKNNKGIRFTWFLSVINNQNYENEIKYLYKLNQDLQSHSYEHIVYNSFDKNYKNISKSNNFISKIKVAFGGITGGYPFSPYANS